MLRSTFLTHVNHNDEPTRDPQENNISMSERRAFTTSINVNDDLRREMDGYSQRTAWVGDDTAYVNGLPLYAPARYIDGRPGGGTSQVAARPTAAKPAAPVVVTARYANPASSGSSNVSTGGSTILMVDRWPWWIWPLAAAAAVAVRGQ